MSKFSKKNNFNLACIIEVDGLSFDVLRLINSVWLASAQRLNKSLHMLRSACEFKRERGENASSMTTQLPVDCLNRVCTTFFPHFCKPLSGLAAIGVKSNKALSETGWTWLDGWTTSDSDDSLALPESMNRDVLRSPRSWVSTSAAGRKRPGPRPFRRSASNGRMDEDAWQSAPQLPRCHVWPPPKWMLHTSGNGNWGSAKSAKGTRTFYCHFNGAMREKGVSFTNPCWK